MLENVYLPQLSFIKFLVGLRGTYFDDFMIFCAHFDSIGFYLFTIITLYFLVPKRGTHYLYLLLFGALLNSVLKLLFGLPRPDFFQAGLSLIKIKGGGLPSGGAQFSFMIYYFLKKEFNRPTINKLFFLFMIVVSFSRLYLGVHFPIDILGGWLLGFLILKIYFKFIKEALLLIPYRFFPRFILTLLGLLISLLLIKSHYYTTIIFTYLVASTLFLFDILRSVPFPQSNLVETRWIYELPWSLTKLLLTIPIFFVVDNLVKPYQEYKYIVPFPVTIFFAIFIIEKMIQKLRFKFVSPNN